MKLLHLLSLGALIGTICMAIVSLGGTSVPWGYMNFQLLAGCNPGGCQNGTQCDAANGVCRYPSGQPVRVDTYLQLSVGLRRWSYCQLSNHGDFNTCFPGLPCGGTCLSDKGQIQALMILGFLAAALAALLVVNRAKTNTWAGLSVIVPIVAAGLYAGTWGTWLTGCHKEISDTLFDANTMYESMFHLDAGFWLSVTSFICAILVAPVQLAVKQKSTAQEEKQAPQNLDSISTPGTDGTGEGPHAGGQDGEGEPKPLPGRPREPNPNPPNFTPTPANKALHLFSLSLLLMSVVTGIVAISTTTLPWTKYDGNYYSTYGYFPPYGYDIDGRVIVTANLGGWTYCQYANDYPFNSGTAPSACVNGGMANTGLIAIAIILSTFCIALIALRGYGKIPPNSMFWAGLTVFFILAVISFFLASFSSWVAPSGCNDALESDINESWEPIATAHIDTAAGFGLAVGAFVASLLAFIFEIALLPCGRRRSEESATNDQYSALVDHEVPYL